MPSPRLEAMAEKAKASKAPSKAMREALRVAIERLGINNYDHEEDEYIALMKSALKTK